MEDKICGYLIDLAARHPEYREFTREQLEKSFKLKKIEVKGEWCGYYYENDWTFEFWEANFSLWGDLFPPCIFIPGKDPELSLKIMKNANDSGVKSYHNS